MDAISLHALHQAEHSLRSVALDKAAAVRVDRLVRDVERQIAALVQATGATVPHAVADAGSDLEISAGWTAYRQWCLELQRDMESKVSALRAQVRKALAGLSPGLRQLVVLDVALERALGARAQKALASLPGLLERRFRQLRASGGTAESKDWQLLFRQEMQSLMQAGLQVRLEPVMGLIEAVADEVKEFQ